MKKVLLAVLLMSPALCTSAAQTLTGFASLAPDTFAPGPTSGQFISPANGVIPAFVDKQPVQGFSSVLRLGTDFLVMSDNGFGSKPNSPDYVLRVYRIDPQFKGFGQGTGAIDVKGSITLHDPDLKVNFPIVADMQFYPDSTIEVDVSIRENRLLTRGEFDIESFRRAPPPNSRKSFWWTSTT